MCRIAPKSKSDASLYKHYRRATSHAVFKRLTRVIVAKAMEHRQKSNLATTLRVYLHFGPLSLRRDPSATDDTGKPVAHKTTGKLSDGRR